MPVFNVSFLRPGAAKGGGSGYGVLVDQLAILENELAKDGNLAPGDYDILTKKAREIRLTGSLTNDQRSNLDVKISAYEKSKSTSKLGDNNDVGRLNREVEDDRRKLTMAFANDPSRFLQGNADLLEAKASRLAETINQLDEAGADSSAQKNEYVSTLQDLQDSLDAIDKSSTYAPGSGKPAGDFIAFIDTNSRGEITKVEVGRIGSKSGYAETDALYGGMQIYGRPNAQSKGEKIFRLGNVQYKGSDLQFQDPDSPGSFRNAPLTANGKGVIKVESYQDVDPTTLRAQQTIRPGGFARGKDGTLYESLATGGYRKYVNTLPDQLGRGDQDVLDVPQSMEAGINSGATETVYGADLPQMSVANPAQLNELSPSAPTPSAAPAPAPASTPVSARTPSPTERAPKSAPGIASRAIGAAKKFFYG